MKKLIMYVAMFIATLSLQCCDDDGDRAPGRPEINVFGKKTDTLYLNSVYREVDAEVAGIGACVSVINITGSVNTAMPGTYFVDYDYTDDKGRRAATVTRTVAVIMTRDDSLETLHVAELYKSISIAKQWEGVSQKINLEVSTMTDIYLDYTFGSCGNSYKVKDVKQYGDSLVLTSKSQIGDTLCVWSFKQLGKNRGTWQCFKPGTDYHKKLGIFSSEVNMAPVKITGP